MFLKYAWGDARKDLTAGLTVAAISVPQAMAYALIAGIDPRDGLYSAIVVTAIASIFGSSAHLINGPTNAISLVVFMRLGLPRTRRDTHGLRSHLRAGRDGGSDPDPGGRLQAGRPDPLHLRIGDLGFMAGAGFLRGLTQWAICWGSRSRGNGASALVVSLVEDS